MIFFSIQSLVNRIGLWLISTFVLKAMVLDCYMKRVFWTIASWEFTYLCTYVYT